jgi:thiamine-phosphate pyrophosphorylase
VKPRNVICLVTDRRRLSPGSTSSASIDCLVDFVRAAAAAGVDLIQLREPDLDARTIETLAERCVDAVRGARVLVNDRLDVALAARAAGVHLRSDSVDAVTARAAAPPGFLLGRSVHGVDEAVKVSRHGALDYLVFGAVFPTLSKPAGHPAAGLAPLAQICATVPLPVLAIGGISLDRASAVAGSGAAGVAAIGLFLPPNGVPAERHLVDTVAALRHVFDTCGAAP